MRSLLILATALTALAGPVLAQTYDSSNSGSVSGSNAAVNVAPSGNVGTSFSGSSPGSRSVSGSQADGGAANGSAGIDFNYSTSTTQNIPADTSIHEDGTVRGNTQAPDVVVSGANACGVPMGASTSVLGFGFGFAGTPVDKGCERRDDAAAAHALGLNDVAVGIMCESPDFADAMQATGHGCPPVGQPQQRPVAATQPLPTGDVNANLNNAVAVQPPAPSAQASYAADHQAWCAGLNPANPADKPYLTYDCRK